MREKDQTDETAGGGIDDRREDGVDARPGADTAHVAPPPSEVEAASPDEDRRPTPVRMVMEGQEEPDATDQPKDRILHDEETGSHWVVSVAGRSASGILPLRTVPLMELVFADSEAPDHPLRRALRYGADLAGLTDDELLGSLRESDPYSTPMREKQETGKEARRRNDRGARKS